MRFKLFILIGGVFLLSAHLVSAQVDLDSIKAKAEQSVREHQLEQTQLESPTLLDQISPMAVPEDPVISPPIKDETQVIWSVWGGRVEFWQYNGQYYLHLG